MLLIISIDNLLVSLIIAWNISVFEGYNDADWISDLLDVKFVSGYVFVLKKVQFYGTLQSKTI